MNEPTQNTLDSILATTIDKWSGQLQRGEPVDIQPVLARFPEHADQLRELFRTLQAVSRLGDDFEDTSLRKQVVTAPKKLGEFELIREVARGGMGVVYEARQTSLDRRVALKLIPLASLLKESGLTRFKNESRAAATLHHPNIVPIYSVGMETGVHYYAMQFIEGPSLAQIIQQARGKTGKERPLPSKQPVTSASDTLPEIQAQLDTVADSAPQDRFKLAARIGGQIAQALAYAHAHGVLHRDVKPGNLLLDPSGNAWITDFGLARIEGDPSITETGQLLGTIRYMAPEQFDPHRVVDQRVDVYGLGLALYELLTLRPVFDGENYATLVSQIKSNPPKAPRAIDPQIPRELDLIVRKAIEHEREDRYQSAEELADDLQAFLDERPIKARPPSLVAHLSRWARRNRSFVVVSALAILLAMSVSTIVLWQARRQAEQKNEELAASQAKMRDSLDLAREAIDGMYADYQNARQSNQTRTATPSEKESLAKVATLYESLAELDVQNPDLNEATVDALYHAASIHRGLGEFRRAADGYRRSLELLEETSLTPVAKLSKRVEAQTRLANSLRWATADAGEIQQAYTQAEKSCQELMSVVKHGGPTVPDAYYALANSLSELGAFHFESRSERQAESYYRDLIEVTEAIINHEGEDEKTLRLLFLGVHGAFISTNDPDRVEEKARLGDRAIDVARDVLRFSDEPRNRSDLASTLSNVAGMLVHYEGNEQDLDRAEELLSEAERIVKPLAQDNPNDVEIVDALPWIYERRASLAAARGDVQQREYYLELTIQIRRKHVEEWGVKEHVIRTVRLYGLLADLQVEQERVSDAMQNLEEGQEFLFDHVKGEANRNRGLFYLGRTYFNLLRTPGVDDPLRGTALERGLTLFDQMRLETIPLDQRQEHAELALRADLLRCEYARESEARAAFDRSLEILRRVDHSYRTELAQLEWKVVLYAMEFAVFVVESDWSSDADRQQAISLLHAFRAHTRLASRGGYRVNERFGTWRKSIPLTSD